MSPRWRGQPAFRIRFRCVRPVSRKPGYVHEGISRDARGHQVVVSDPAETVAQHVAVMPRPGVTVNGFEQCRSSLAP